MLQQMTEFKHHAVWALVSGSPIWRKLHTRDLHKTYTDKAAELP